MQLERKIGFLSTIGQSHPMEGGNKNYTPVG